MKAAQDKTAEPVAKADLTSSVCPMTFLLAKLALEKRRRGEVVELVLEGSEALGGVPRSLKEEGHRIERVIREGDRVRLWVRRGE